MESNKVKLPREVIEAIQYYSKPYTKYGVLDCILGEPSQVAVKAREILISTYGEGECWDVLMTALVNGYEVEQTPEDKVRELFRKTNDSNEWTNLDWQRHYYTGKKDGIKEALDILNIKIKGVND